MVIDSEQLSFVNYLKGLKKYKFSTIENYAQAINILTRQINKHLPTHKIGSLYNLKDYSNLNNIYEKWMETPEIQIQEKRQHNRYSNAFKRYIEFCKSN